MGDEGQATLEFALITSAFIVILVALRFFGVAVESGLWVDHALMAATHHIQGSIGWIVDIFIY